MNASRMLAPVGLVTGLLLAGPALAAGNLYKWVDDEGNVTYSQQKPPDTEAETIRLRAATLDSSGARDKLDALNDRADESTKDREFSESHASAQKERDERLKKNCEVARENLRILQSSPRVQDKDAEGNPYFLDADAIKARLEKTQMQIEQNCG